MTTGRNASRLAKEGLGLVERLWAGTRKINRHQYCEDTSTNIQQDHMGTQLQYAVQNVMPEDTSLINYPTALTGSAGNMNAFGELATVDTNSSFFSDIEPSLLQYSHQDLALFGMNGFSSPEDTNVFWWSLTDVDPTLGWQNDAYS